MSATYIEELGDIYGANVIEESETVGKQECLVQKTDALKTTGPEAAEGFEPVKADSKVGDEGHVEKLSNPVTKKKEKTVKSQSESKLSSGTKSKNLKKEVTAAKKAPQKSKKPASRNKEKVNASESNQATKPRNKTVNTTKN